MSAAEREPGRRRKRLAAREEGVALILVLTAISVLLITLTEFQETTSTALHASTADRDALRAEYLARSGVNLTRLLVANEPAIRATVAPMLMMLLRQRSVPQLNVWDYADDILGPFSNFEAAKLSAAGAGIDLTHARGVGGHDGTFEVLAITENAMLNISRPVANSDDEARRRQALCLFGLLGGLQTPSAYDPIFERRDADGQTTTRLDLIDAILDWWDFDTEQSSFDPATQQVLQAGGEDDFYQRLPDRYQRKNAPFDSIEELRLVRGMSDEMWANLVEPDPDDPRARVLTIYGAGYVNVNYGSPQALWCAVCSAAPTATLCADAAEAQKFITIINTLRSIVRLPLFEGGRAFLAFLRGEGLYADLTGFLGPDNPMLFRPIQTTPAMENMFVDAARIFSFYVTGTVGRTRVRVHAVVNYDDQWNPPPPNSGRQSPLGVVQYWRMD